MTEAKLMKEPLLKGELDAINALTLLPFDIAALITNYSRKDWKPAFDRVLVEVRDVVDCFNRRLGHTLNMQACQKWGTRTRGGRCKWCHRNTVPWRFQPMGPLMYVRKIDVPQLHAMIVEQRESQQRMWGSDEWGNVRPKQKRQPVA